MAATGAQRRLAAAVIEYLESQPVRLRCGFGEFVTVVVAMVLDSFLQDQFIGQGPRIDRQAIEIAGRCAVW